MHFPSTSLLLFRRLNSELSSLVDVFGLKLTLLNIAQFKLHPVSIPQSHMKNRLTTYVREYIRTNHRTPTKIHVTLEDEILLSTLTPEEFAGLAPGLFQDGQRSAMPRIYNMDVIWDADALRLE
jgi:hypothetical protein